MGEEWREAAACRGEDTAVFFPLHDDADAAAKAVCAGCDVRAQCLNYAIVTRQRDGVWGGANAKERDRIVRKRRETRLAG